MNQGPSQIGQTLSGRYQIEEILGRGGLSTIYKGTDRALQRTVVIEVLDPQFSADPSFVRRFEREFTAAAQLRHPNIAQVFDFNHDGDTYYIVREYIAAETLQHRLWELSKLKQQLPIDTALDVTLNISRALEYAHSRGQVHHDIKPANIILERREAILTEFGMVKTLASGSLTGTEVIAGSPGYMSPEIIRGEAGNDRSDIYSLGATLYEMLSGRPPFMADSPMTLMMKHLLEPLPDLRALRPDVSPDLVHIVERCLAKDPLARYQSASELSADVRRVQAHLPPSTAVDTVAVAEAKGVAAPPAIPVITAPPPTSVEPPHPMAAARRPSFFRTILEFLVGDRKARKPQAGPPIMKREEATIPGKPVRPTSSDQPGNVAVDEVSFTAYHPKEGRVDSWYSLLVYAHIAAALKTVRKDAQKFAEAIGPPREITSRASTPIARGTPITIIPACNGISFNPERITFTWSEAFHRADFRFKADTSLAEAAANGQISIHAGPLIIGTLKFAMLVSQTETPSVAEHEEQARMYLSNRIFISYSHQDTDFALMFRNVLKAVGYEVLIDIDDLRAGQMWNEELMRLIERADIFQLFWSANSSQSEYCRREWQHALKQNKPAGFIRPIYWQKPLPPPPEELSKFHFDYVDLKTAAR